MRCGRYNPYGIYCRACRVKNLPERVLACFAYDGAVKELIHNFKYKDVSSLADSFALEISELLKDCKDYVVCPVPLSSSRKRWRGFNQSEIIARKLSQKTGLCFGEFLGRGKSRFTQVQAGSKQKRKQNIKGVFYLKKEGEVPKNIILVDDVVTSGATVEEATKVLKRAGAEKVVVTAVAMGK